jgi:hypothetical protein
MFVLQYYNKHNTNDQTTSFQQAILTKSLSSFHLKMDSVFKMLCFKKLMVTNSVQNNTYSAKYKTTLHVRQLPLILTYQNNSYTIYV